MGEDYKILQAHSSSFIKLYKIIFSSFEGWDVRNDLEMFTKSCLPPMKVYLPQTQVQLAGLS